MNTNFFKRLYELAKDIDIHITVSKKQDQLIVSVLPVQQNLEDEAKRVIQPMILKGTPEELDEGFYEAIANPIKQAAGLFANMDSYLKSVEEARKSSKMQKEQEDKEKKEKEGRQKKYETLLQKVAELEAKEKWGEAIGAMPKASDFPEQAADIEKKLSELKQKHGQLSLL